MQAGQDFAQGCGNVVNNGAWGYTSHGEKGRLRYFDQIIGIFKNSGMTADMQ